MRHFLVAVHTATTSAVTFGPAPDKEAARAAFDAALLAPGAIRAEMWDSTHGVIRRKNLANEGGGQSGQAAQSDISGDLPHAENDPAPQAAPDADGPPSPALRPRRTK